MLVEKIDARKEILNKHLFEYQQLKTAFDK